MVTSSPGSTAIAYSFGQRERDWLAGGPHFYGSNRCSVKTVDLWCVGNMYSDKPGTEQPAATAYSIPHQRMNECVDMACLASHTQIQFTLLQVAVKAFTPLCVNGQVMVFGGQTRLQGCRVALPVCLASA